MITPVDKLNLILNLEYEKIRLVKDLILSIDEGCEDGDNEAINEVLSELSCDLAYFVPNEKDRKEDPSYFGNDRLILEIKQALAKINLINEAKNKIH